MIPKTQNIILWEPNDKILFSSGTNGNIYAWNMDYILMPNENFGSPAEKLWEN